MLTPDDPAPAEGLHVLPLQEKLDRRWSDAANSIPALADWILEEARRRGASDLHFEPAAAGIRFRWRIDGCLADAGCVEGECCPNLIQRIKVLANLLTYRTDIPQDGRIEGRGDGCDMRVSVYPTVLGEKVVVRFFQDRAGPEISTRTGQAAMSFAELGLSEAAAASLRNVLAQPQGLLLLTGPAGSGKTTTLYAAVQHLVAMTQGARQIVTIEDPVERILKGVTHTELNPAAQIDYPSALKAILRQDPEVILIGEIRDAETAQVAVQAALTGHLILSTMHAPSAPEVLLRLLHFGVDPFLAASVVSAVLAQRLVRRICPNCRQPDEEAQLPLSHEGLKAWKCTGCDACSKTGYKGRLLVAELLKVEDDVREAVLNRADARELRRSAAKSGWQGLWATGLNQVAEGNTTLGELRRVLPTYHE